MQTFLPHPNFSVSVIQLDYRRLGKQRVECGQLQTAIQTVREITGCWRTVSSDEWRELKCEAGRVPWASHPCSEMWCNNILALMAYRDCCIREWVRRGYNNTMPLMLTRDYHDHPRNDFDMPHWLGDKDFHASHRSNLLRKDHDHYSQFDWTETPDLEYVWPTAQGATQ